MQMEKPNETEPRKKTKPKVIKLLAAFLIVLILLAVFLVPAYISSESARKMILTRINRSVDGKADFANLSMGWLKGIRITNISFNDNNGQISVEVKQIATKPHYGSMLTGSLSFGKTVVDEPKIEINLATPQPKQTQSNAQLPKEKVGLIGLPVKKIDLVINNGRVKVTGDQAEAVELSRINSKLNLRPPNQKTNFDINMAVADKGQASKISANGHIKSGKTKKGWTLKGATGDLTVEVNDLNVSSLGSILALAGVEISAEGNISADMKSEIKDGKIENLIAEFRGRDLDISGPALKGDSLKSSVLDVSIKLNRQKDLINIEELNFRNDWAKAQASGVVPTTFKSLAEFLQAESPYDLKADFECDLATALSQMPRTFGLKEGTTITSGRLSGNIQTSAQAKQRNIKGQATLENLQGSVGSKPVALSEPVIMKVDITSDKAGVRFDKLNISAAFCDITCSGTKERLDYDAKVDLAKLQAELGQFIDAGQYQMAGEFFARGQLRSDKKKTSAIGTSKLKNFYLTSQQGSRVHEPQADINYSVVIPSSRNFVDVDSVTVDASFGQVKIKNAVLPLNEKSTKSTNLPISAKVDLEKFRPFAIALASFPQEMQLAGIVDSQISISEKKGILRIATDSTEIKNLKVRYPEKEPFEQSVISIAFDAEVDPSNKTIDVKKLQVISPQIKIEGNLRQINKGNKTNLRGQVNCEYDWSAISTVAAPFLPKNLKLEGKRTDTINFASQYPIGQTDKMLANLDSKGSLGFDRGEYMGLEFGPTNVDIQIQNGLLTIAPFSTTVNKGQLQFAAGADFNRKPTLLRTPQPIQIIKDIQITDEMTKKLLMYVNPIFANTFNASGVANFHCERLAIPLAGAGENDLEVVGTISIEQLRLEGSNLLSQIFSVGGASAQGQNITIHPTKFVLRDGFLRYDDMQMDVGRNPINFQGVIGLDKSLNMRIVLPYTTSGKTVRVGQETEGSREAETEGQRIVLPLSGTVDHPELDVGKLFEEQLKEQLEEKLREGLEGLFK